MKKKRSFIIGIVCFVVLLGILGYVALNNNKEKGDLFLKNIDSQRAYEYIDYLSATIGTRTVGTEEEHEAALYVGEQLEKAGCKVEVIPVDYVDGKKLWNIVGIKNSINNEQTDIVYVTSHLDCDGVSSGANDNASGVAGVIEIAHALKDIEVQDEVRFIAFGGEEVGLLGSQAYVEALSKEDKGRSKACFNLDMLATDYKGISELGIYTCDGKENIVTEAVRKAGEKFSKDSTEEVSYEAELELSEVGAPIMITTSDHKPFNDAGIPAVVFTNINPKPALKENISWAIEPTLHTPEDSIEHISIPRLERSIKLVGLAVYNMVTEK